MARKSFGIVAVVSAAAVASLLAGCAGGQTGGDPGGASLPPGKTCKDIRRDLDRLDARGVPSRIEAQRAGAKLNPSQREDVDRYNTLLAQYLGARCHM